MKVKGKVLMLLLVFLVAITANLLAGGQQEEAESEEPGRMHITWLPHNPKGYINEENSPTEIYVEDKFNIDIDIVPVDKYNLDMINIYLATNDPPDIMDGLSHERDDLINMDRLGLIREITKDMIKENAPDMYKLIMEHAPVKAWYDVSIDGKIMAVPAINIAVASPQHFALRNDWVEKAGVTDPMEIDTLEEFEELLIKIREGDPNGNGLKDEFPISIWTQSHKLNDTISPLFAAYGLRAMDWKEENGELIYAHVHDNYKEMLILLQSWYKKGLIEPEFPIDKRNDVKKKMMSGLIGGYASGNAWVQELTNNPFGLLKEQDPNLGAAWFPDLQGPYGKGGMARSASFGRKMMFGAQTSDDKVVKMLQVMNEILTNPEVYKRVNSGIEGRDYTMKDGIIHPKPEASKFEYLVKEGMKAFEMINWIAGSNVDIRLNYERKLAIDFAVENVTPYFEVFTVGPEADVADQYYQIAEDLRPMEEEFFYKMIIGKGDIDSEWKNYVDTWYKSGGDKLTEWTNSAHYGR
ncbi:MAG: hypothetical protein HQ557_03755 [Bacteroidetes bacterium]|nr:hypothetical protein [Bacteroidota bacterium]